jgi:hypothetical protein
MTSEKEPAIDRARRTFVAEWAKRWPIDCLGWKSDRDRKVLKDLVDEFGERAVVDTIIPEYFSTTETSDPFIMRGMDYSVTYMKRVARRLILNRHRRANDPYWDVHPQTAANIREVDKATGRDRRRREAEAAELERVRRRAS